MQAGIHTMPASVYHQDPAPAPSLSNSVLKTLLSKSPLHARLMHPRLTPQEPREDEGKFDLGSAAHSLLLEGQDIIQVCHYDDWRTKAAKEDRAMAREAGRIPMLPHQHAEANLMVEIARDYLARSVLGNLLADGKPEQTLIWQDEGTNIWCRGRLDWLTEDRSVILDYKTTAMSSPAQFCRSSMSAFGYDTQSAFYLRGMRAVQRVETEFVFLVQEDEAPYSCYLVQCAPSMQEVAEHKVQRGIDAWAACLKTDNWPGYSEHIYHAEASAWQVEQELSA